MGLSVFLPVVHMCVLPVLDLLYLVLMHIHVLFEYSTCFSCVYLSCFVHFDIPLECALRSRLYIFCIICGTEPCNYAEMYWTHKSGTVFNLDFRAFAYIYCVSYFLKVNFLRFSFTFEACGYIFYSATAVSSLDVSCSPLFFNFSRIMFHCFTWLEF